MLPRTKGVEVFDAALRSWVEAFCDEQHYSPQQDQLFAEADDRLPQGLRETIAIGLQNGAIRQVKGCKFSPIGAPEGKEYSWLSRLDQTRPRINWEYFVQAAEYARLYSIASEQGLAIKWEDDKMDIAIYRADVLLLCCEAKEETRTLERLVGGIRKYGEAGLKPDSPRMKEDAHEKAKYLIKHRPAYFSGVSVGRRYEFSVAYRKDENRFSLREDIIPLTPMKLVS